MSNESYFISIPQGGSTGLGRLDHCFNPTTQEFLVRAGLKPGMSVLDIGCGSGVMTCWLAQQVGSNGKVLGIENNLNQLSAAEANAKKQSFFQVKFKNCSAYELSTLEESFDFIYCRFVLHHLHNPMEVITKIYQKLNPNGIYAAEEGIVNFAFSYPFSPAWGDESTRIPPVWEDAKNDLRDGNIGVKMFHKMQAAGFKVTCAKIIHPLLVSQEEKSLLLMGREEFRESYLQQGHTEEMWRNLGKMTENIVLDDSQIIGFYASC